MTAALHTPEIPVVRAVLATPEIRADDPADPNSLGLLDIRWSPFNTWYRVESFWEGEFIERTIPGAYKQTIKEDLPGMRVLFDHGFDPQLGNKVLGPIRSLAEEADSPHAEVPLFDTSYNRDLLPGLKAGVYGSSMRFRVLEDSWNDEPDASDYNPKAVPERTIKRARVFEFGPVTFPANPEATAGVRSATDHYMELLARADERAYADALRSVQQIHPNFTGAPVARSDGRGERTTSTAEAPGNGEQAAEPQVISGDPFDDPEQRHLLLRARGVL